VRRAAKEKMSCRLIVACTVRTHRRLSSDTVEVAGQKRPVDRSQLEDSDALASGPAKSPVRLLVILSH